MSGHCLWLQTGAELGIPGLACLLSFYGISIARLWPLTRRRNPVSDAWLRDVARMAIAGIIAFAVAAQFLSVISMEVPYYVVLLGAAALKLSSAVAKPVEERRKRPPPEHAVDDLLCPTAQSIPTYS
jgi:hypothetical protein